MTKNITKVTIPSLGESLTEGTIGQWLKEEGAYVRTDEPLVEIETDKVTTELPSPVDGLLLKHLAAQGDTLDIGADVADIDTSAQPPKGATETKKNQDSAPVAAGSGEKRTQEKSTPTPVAAAQGAESHKKTSPAVRELLEKHQLNPNDIPSLGADDRLTKSDLLHHLLMKDAPVQQTTIVPNVPHEEAVPMSRLRQTIARRLKDAQNTAAILTTYNEVDMTNVLAIRSAHKEAFQKKYDVKLGFMSFFAKASIVALKEIPAVNAEIKDDAILYKNHYDISIAVGTKNGLVVPVIRHADQLSFAEFEAKLAELAQKARDGALTLDDMSGGTFTISNGGVYGSLLSSPILNMPQVAILGMHKTQMRPVVMPDGSIAARPMMYLALSYDHRIIDGKDAVTFLVRVKECLEQPERMLMGV